MPPTIPPENKHGPHDMFRGRVFVGDAIAARDFALLGQFRIARILDLSGGPEYATAEGTARVAVAIEDRVDASIVDAMAASSMLEAIDEAVRADAPILVHCAVGASRSASVVIAWLMKRERMTLARALNHCKARRNAVRPNNGFFRELRALDVELNGADSMPLESIEYSQWCLQNPRGTKAGCVVS